MGLFFVTGFRGVKAALEHLHFGNGECNILKSFFFVIGSNVLIALGLIIKKKVLAMATQETATPRLENVAGSDYAGFFKLFSSTGPQNWLLFKIFFSFRAHTPSFFIY